MRGATRIEQHKTNDNRLLEAIMKFTTDVAGHLAAAALICCVPAANAKVLFDDNFESSGRYFLVDGSPQLADATGPFATRSLAFNSQGNAATFYYDQIQYSTKRPTCPIPGSSLPGCNAPQLPQIFRVSFDVFTSGLVGSVDSFTVLFDTPEVRRLDFEGSGDIAVFNPGNSGSWVSKVGTYADREAIHVDINFDLAGDLWNIALNGLNVYSNRIGGDRLDAIRFSHGAVTTNVIDFNATSYLDNVHIEQVPLPASVVLFGSGLAGLFSATRRRHRNPV